MVEDHDTSLLSRQWFLTPLA